jgi:predicted dehydrogenase
MRIGIIGHGHISKHYFAAAKEIRDFDIVAVCDVNPAAFSGLARHVVRYTDLDDFLSNPGIDAVIVSVPTSQHASVAAAVLESGKPLMLEKPATIARQDFEALEKISRAAGVPAIMLFHYVRAAEVAAAAGYLRSCPHPAHIAWHSTSYDPYNSGLDLHDFSLVNAWIDSGINQLSVFLTLFPTARLRLKHATMTPPAGERQGTISASAEFEILGPIAGLAVFEVNWALGSDRKSARISLARPQSFIEVDHSDESVQIDTAGEAQRVRSATAGHRLTNHYVNLFPWAIEQLSKGSSNWEFAAAVHAPFFDVLESC